jgi:hypothetical protein
VQRGQTEILEREQAYEFVPQVETYLKSYDDAATWAAEVLDGAMRTHFEFVFNGNDFYGRDGRSMRHIFEQALIEARRMALSRPELAFEVRRRQIEMEEFNDMVAMGHGDRGNTMVVVSDFPPELMNATTDVGGYNVTRKQTMLRVLAMQPDGQLNMYTQTLDKSDRASLEAIFQGLGYEPQPGELLGQRMHLDLGQSDQEFLINRLTGVYDRSLEQHNPSKRYYAGREDSNRLNTYDFVQSQTDLIEAFARLQMQNPAQAETMRYEFAAAMEKRFLSRQQIDPIRAVSKAVGRDIYREMLTAGQEARSSGKTFSGCGVSTQANSTPNGGGQSSTGDQLDEAGYGNKSEEDSKLPSKIRCINCKEKVPSKEVVKVKSWCCPKCKYEVDICTGKVLCAGKK